MALRSLIFLFLIGCSGSSGMSYYPVELAAYPVCRNYVEFHWDSMEDHWPDVEKRIAYGKRNGENHVQMQAFINGEWEDITHFPKDIVIITGERDSNFTINEYGTLEEAKRYGWIK